MDLLTEAEAEAEAEALSLALLVAKYYIYKCNLDEESLLFSLFKLQSRENTMIERYIAIKNKLPSFFTINGNALL